MVVAAQDRHCGLGRDRCSGRVTSPRWPAARCTANRHWSGAVASLSADTVYLVPLLMAEGITLDALKDRVAGLGPPGRAAALSAGGKRSAPARSI